MENKAATVFNANESRFNIIYYANEYENDITQTFSSSASNLRKVNNYAEILNIVNKLSIYELDVSILLEIGENDSEGAFSLIEQLKTNWLSRNIVIILLLTHKDSNITKKAFEMMVSDRSERAHV